MLKSFYVKNYKSWKDEVMINMKAESISEHPENTIEIKNGKERLLKNIAIYGANASGKSNLLDAFSFMYNKVYELILLKEWKDLIGNDQIFSPFVKTIAFQPTICKTFANKISNSTFEITFIVDNKEYSYGFELKDNKIKNEWLDINNKTYFDRKTNTTNIKSYKMITDKIPDNQLFLSHIMMFAKTDTNDPLFHTASFLGKTGIIKDFEKFDDLMLNTTLNTTIKRDKKTFDKLNNLLKIIDFGISGIEIDQNTGIIFFKHQSKNEIFRIPASEESQGTKKMILILLGLFGRLEFGGVIVADEFTSSLHPLLSKLVLDMISNEDYNKGNAQIIFTTHDIFLMRKEQLRRDEIAFIYKNKYGISKFKRLYDIKDREMKRVRNDAVYWKNYLKGFYEGLPNIDYDKFILGK